MKAAPADDATALEQWWGEFLATGRLPAGLHPVQQRLIRAVHRGQLPSGPVYVKTMTFPRAKDRLRYLLRALPGAHEAAMLRAVAAAGLRCPEVVAVRTARRAGLPFRSFLVLRELPVREAPEPALSRLRDAAAVASRLLAAGVAHRDLHGGNFVRLADGALAVLDLQSASLRRGPLGSRAHRVEAAARLLREHLAEEPEAGGALCAAGLLHDTAELAAARRRAADELAHYRRGRVLRCLGESTEFRRLLHGCGVEHRQRADLPPGRWLPPRAGALQQWLGQRARHVFENRSPVFPAFFRKWWWLGGKGSLYVPRACSEDRIEAELTAAAEGFIRYRGSIVSRWAGGHGHERK